MEKTKEQFLKDVEEIYEFVKISNNKIYDFLDFENLEKKEILEDFLRENNLRICEESIYATASRITSLRTDPLIKFMESEKLDKEVIKKILTKSYYLAKDIHMKKFEEILEYINSKNLLTKFYRELITSFHNVGKSFNKWFVNWNEHIIHSINEDLKNKYGTDEKVLEFLRMNNLQDKGHGGIEADRSYTILSKQNDQYTVKTYFEFFDDVKEIIEKIRLTKEKLSKLKDETYNLDQEYQDYFQALIDAFIEKDRNSLVEKWCKVDEKWMKITSPIQISHPLEYYEDHYRKAVSPEWDIRIINPKLVSNRANEVKEMYNQLFDKIGNGFEKVREMCINNINRTQNYLGKQMFYYGSHLEGLSSAQVVPNDMIASKNFGKKIFSFADKDLESARRRPFMMLAKIIYEEDFVKESRRFLMNETKKWYDLYDLSTIGHEYGHILWLDNDTETIMNNSGNFKNIEEFKATTGGIITFFLKEREELKKEFVRDIVTRAVGLISTKEINELRPYYCEGLIHLKGLFDCGILTWNGNESKLIVNISNENYDKLKSWYFKTYENLARKYLEKSDANNFLSEYAKLDGDYFMPVDSHIKDFVKYFYEMYTKYANVIDKDDKKENYINR